MMPGNLYNQGAKSCGLFRKMRLTKPCPISGRVFMRYGLCVMVYAYIRVFFRTHKDCRYKTILSNPWRRSKIGFIPNRL